MAAPTTHVRVGGVWKEVNKIHVKAGGTWKEVTTAYNRVSSTYKKIHEAASTLTISANTANYNWFTAAGSPVSAGTFNLVINSGVHVYSTNPNNPSLDAQGFPASSTLTITNNGNIYGAGGKGGDGNTGSQQSGQSGGDALEIDQNTTIDNTSGNLYGGGRGGNSGIPAVSCTNSGGGGGGGQGMNQASGTGGNGGSASFNGQAGQAGTTSAAGQFGLGGQCFYSCGETQCSDSSQAGINGVAWGHGRACRENGATLTFTGGNNSGQVKGSVS